MQLSISLFVLLTAYGAAAEDACPPSEIMKLAQLYANSNLHECQKISTDFSIASPTDTHVKAMCSSDKCRELIKDVLAMKPADCYLSFAEAKFNAYKVATSFDDACKTHMKNNYDSWKSQPAWKSIDDKQYPPLKRESNTTYRHEQEQQKIVKDGNRTRVANIDDAQDEDAGNSSAEVVVPMPTTTPQANV